MNQQALWVGAWFDRVIPNYGGPFLGAKVTGAPPMVPGRAAPDTVPMVKLD